MKYRKDRTALASGQLITSARRADFGVAHHRQRRIDLRHGLAEIALGPRHDAGIEPEQPLQLDPPVPTVRPVEVHQLHVSQGEARLGEGDPLKGGILLVVEGGGGGRLDLDQVPAVPGGMPGQHVGAGV